MADDWKSYEKEIFDLFREEYPTAQITLNQQREGRYSKSMRQIDVLIEGQIAGSRFSIVVDGKYYKRKVDVKGVETFISMVHDIGAHKGLIITQKGYSDAALARAFNDPHDIELDILSFEELKQFQGFEAIPYSGTPGALIKAPFGWVIDGNQYQKPSPPAHIYQRGLDLESAMGRGEFMYVQFWNRKKDNENLKDLFAIQERNLKRVDSNVTIEYLPTISRNDAQTALRVAVVPKYVDVREYAGFVEFEEFIFFIVLLTPRQLARKNVRKLESVMLSALPLTVDDHRLKPKQVT
jgi:hypothetical protein